MTRRGARQVYDEVTAMTEQLRRTGYAFGNLVSEMRVIRNAIEASNDKVLRQLTDTQATLEYLKSYIGIGDFFEEAIRQGKQSETGRMDDNRRSN